MNDKVLVFSVCATIVSWIAMYMGVAYMSNGLSVLAVGACLYSFYSNLKEVA